jgi:CHAD domain-containing protein
MMRIPAVQHALERRVRALERDLPAALGSDVEALHRSRVASRRLREILPALGLGRGGGRQSPVRKLQRRLRRLTSALGGVRELDVALEILDEIRHDHPDLDHVLLRARSAVEAERRQCQQDMIRQVEEVQAGAMLEEFSDLLSVVARPTHATRAALLRRRLARRTDGLDAAVAEAGSLFAFDRLHQVRIEAKKLRYVLELIHEFGRVPTLRFTVRLKRLQDLLGRLHDLEVVAGYVQHERGAEERQYAAEIDRATSLLEREMRELHASYLASVHLLARVISGCRGEVDRRLGGAGAPGPHEGDSHGR